MKAGNSFILCIKGCNSESTINRRGRWEIMHGTFCLLQRDFMLIATERQLCARQAKLTRGTIPSARKALEMAVLAKAEVVV